MQHPSLDFPNAPKAREVEQKLREMLTNLATGAKLPSERALARSFGCNFLTVRRALAPLVAEGAISRRIGSGTFVSKSSGPIATNTRARIGVLVLQNADAHAYHVLRAIARAAKEHDIELSSTWAPNFDRDGVARAKALAREGCKACILPWIPADHLAEISALASESPIPLTLPTIVAGLEKFCFERGELFGAHAIAATNAVGRYLLSRGNHRIAFLGPDTPDDPILQKKLSAYASFTSREKLTVLCGLVNPSAASIDQLAERWKPLCDDLAIIAYDDEHAVRLITAMHKLGLSAPTNFRIVGFNNTEASRYSDPPLTTVCQNFEYLGEAIVRSALALARGDSWQSSETPRTRLIVRESCGGASTLPSATIVAPSEIDFVSDAEIPLGPSARIETSSTS